ncbi:MAG: Ig-like domain-containing protein [Verrucomicrobiota bacterium]
MRGTAATNAVFGTGGQPYKLTKVGPNFVSLVYAQVDPALGDIEVKEGGLGFEVTTSSLGNPTNTLTIYSNAYVQFWQNTLPLDKRVLLADGGQIKGGSGTSNYVVGPIVLPSGLGQLGAAAGATLTVSGNISGTGGVKKLLPGIVTLTGTNTYTGTTLISAGTLVVSNAYSISNSPGITLSPGTTFDVSGVINGYSVVTGQTLVGRGTVLGPLAIQPGGQLTIDGASPSTLAVSNALTLAGTTALRLGRIGGVVTNDRIAGVNALTVGGTLNLTLATNSEALQAGDTFQLFQASTFSGAFVNVNLPILGSGTGWNTNSLAANGTLSVVAVVVNHPPVATNVGVVLPQNASVNIAITNLLKAASDPDGDPLSLASVVALSTNGGSVLVQADQIVYTPRAGFTGDDRFSYVISDGQGGTASAEVELFVAARPVPIRHQVAINPAPSGFNVGFAGDPGVTYYVQRATSLSGPWTNVVTIVAPAHGIIQYQDATASSLAAFYRTVKP